MKILNRLTILGLLTLFIFSFSIQQAKASPVDYGHDFGLIVHQQNKNLTVPSGKGQQVLESFFADGVLKASADDTNQFMTQRDFLLSFEKLRLDAEDKKTRLSDDILYPVTWLKARRNNWLPDAKLTYKTMQDFLYRYSVSQKHGGIPYFDGLVLDEEEINTKNFNSVNLVVSISDDLVQRVANLKNISKPSREQKKLLILLDEYNDEFLDLEEELIVLNHPLNKLQDLSADIREKIMANDLNEILDTITYNYSHNNANRIHNLVTGAMQMNGQVFQPDEVINFEKELGRDGWWKYKFGWVIFGGAEEWQFGGGLCGSATITFTPSWRAGLEIIKRYPHSVYYRNLYPEDSFALDATIYRGHKNLIMKNTTESPLLYYVENDPENKEITMYLIGNSPYSSIDIEGPIKISWGNYKWIRRMERFDGTVVEDELFTRYGLIY